MNKFKNILLVALTNKIGTESKVIQLLPYGHIKTKKGDFIVDEKAQEEIMKNFSGRENDLVVDYEHQTLTGGIAPAAGWIKNLENRGKDGIWGEVEWTTKAESYISNKEYKYLSPVIFINKNDKRVRTLHSAALTNDPAIDGMIPIANKNNFEEDESTMEFLKEIAKMLGLDETATEEQIMEALKKKMENAEPEVQANKEIVEISSLLDLKEDANIEDIKSKITALKNPEGYVTVERFEKLEKQLKTKEKGEIVTKALKAGKITPAQREWAEKYAEQDLAGFKSFIEKAPQVVPLEKIVLKDDPKPTNKELDEEEIRVCNMLGVNQEDYKKMKGAE